MQLRTPSALAIYVGSYLPLSVILLAQDVDMAAIRRGSCSWEMVKALECSSPLKNWAFSASAVGICLACFLFTLYAIRLLSGSEPVTVTESKHTPADLINYVIPYVVSFMGLDYGEISKLIGFAVFFAWIFWITYKSGQIVLNPVLAVLGWRLFEVKYRFPGNSDVFTGRTFARVEIEPGQTYLKGALQDVMVISARPEGA